MIRVAQVVGRMAGGGVESVVMNYYRHVDRSRVQFDFLVSSGSPLVPREEIESLGGRVFEVPPYQRAAEYQRELARLFRDGGWRVVHSHANALSVFPLRAATRAGVPVRIAHSHSTSGRGEPLRNALKAALRTQANRYPTHRMACSRAAGEWLFGRGAEFEVLPNAVDLRRFYFDPKAREEARAELGVGDDRLLVGHVGRFVTVKNHMFLLDAFEKLVRARRDAVLALTGDGELRQDAERRAAQLGLTDRVLFLGQRDDAWRLYQAFDVFVLPSLYEGLPVVAVEAQAAGLPCLLSDRITREVNVTGTVRFLSIDDPTAWIDSLLRLSADAERSVRTPALAAYDIDTASLHLTDIYEQLAEEAL